MNNYNQFNIKNKAALNNELFDNRMIKEQGSL